MEMKLDYLHDPDRHFIVRLCMDVDEAKVVVPGSVVKDCEECDTAVWYDPAQEIPEPEDEDLDIEREVILCMRCGYLHMSLEEGVEWAPPVRARKQEEE